MPRQIRAKTDSSVVEFDDYFQLIKVTRALTLHDDEVTTAVPGELQVLFGARCWGVLTPTFLHCLQPAFQHRTTTGEATMQTETEMMREHQIVAGKMNYCVEAGLEKGRVAQRTRAWISNRCKTLC